MENVINIEKSNNNKNFKLTIFNLDKQMLNEVLDYLFKNEQLVIKQTNNKQTIKNKNL